jgi:hypothetical protein
VFKFISINAFELQENNTMYFFFLDYITYLYSIAWHNRKQFCSDIYIYVCVDYIRSYDSLIVDVIVLFCAQGYKIEHGNQSEISSIWLAEMATGYLRFETGFQSQYYNLGLWSQQCNKDVGCASQGSVPCVATVAGTSVQSIWVYTVRFLIRNNQQI